MTLGQPAYLGEGGLSKAHGLQSVVPGAAAPAQDGGAGPDPVQLRRKPVEQGEGAGGVDHPGLESRLVDGIQGLLKLLQLALGLGVVGPGGMELGIHPGQGHVGHGAIGQQQLFRLADQKAPKAHARVHLDVGLGHGGAVARQGVQGHARVHGGDGAHHVQVHQPLQLLPVGGGPEHQDLLVHKARLAQGLGLGDLGHGEAPDALVPQQLGQSGGAHPLPVSGDHAVNGGPGGPVLDDRQVILDGGSVDDQLAHDAALPFISVSGRGGTGPAA